MDPNNIARLIMLYVSFVAGFICAVVVMYLIGGI